MSRLRDIEVDLISIKAGIETLLNKQIELEKKVNELWFGRPKTKDINEIF